MLETVKVVDANNKRGWKIINKSDMTESDVEYSESGQAAKPVKKKARQDDKAG